MGELLWPADPKREGGAPPPSAIESGEGPRRLTILVAPEALIREHGAWIRSMCPVDWAGTSLEEARAWAARQSRPDSIHLIADPGALRSIPGFKSGRAVGSLFGVPDGQFTWLAAVASEVFLAPRRVRRSEILPLTEIARWAAAFPRRFADIRLRAEKPGLRAAITYRSSFLLWPRRRAKGQPSDG